MDDLINEARKGNKEAFTNLMINLEDDMYKIARARLSNSADIEDSVQETILEAFKFIHKLKHNEYFKTWIIKILINNCNKIYGKRKKEKNLVDKFDTESSFVYDNKTEDNMEFYLLIKDLNYDERIAIILYYMEGYTTKEIGKLLNSNENTIKARISRAKIKIKQTCKGGE